MHIFIDESGSFIWKPKLTSRISCVGALAVPDKNLLELTDKFLKLSWKIKGEEVKGSELQEPQIVEVLLLLEKYEAIFKVASIDMEMHRDEYVTQFKMAQAQGLVNGLTAQHKPTLVDELENLAKQLRESPNQLVVQGMLFVDLLERFLEIVPTYWALRDRTEIEIFRWFVDAKDPKKNTPFESLWDKLIVPLVAHGERGMNPLPGVDYGGFKRFERRMVSRPPDYAPIPEEQRSLGIDLKMILKEHFQTVDSKENVGLQLVDIVTNAFRRILHGRLAAAVSPHLGALLLKKRKSTLSMVRLSSVPEEEIPKSPPYGILLNEIGRGARQAFTPEYQAWIHRHQNS